MGVDNSPLCWLTTAWFSRWALESLPASSWSSSCPDTSWHTWRQNNRNSHSAVELYFAHTRRLYVLFFPLHLSCVGLPAAVHLSEAAPADDPMNAEVVHGQLEERGGGGFKQTQVGFPAWLGLFRAGVSSSLSVVFISRWSLPNLRINICWWRPWHSLKSLEKS